MNYKYRIQYTKESSARWLGHLEVTDIIRRACRASRMPLKYSEGFHPLPRVSMGDALSVGMESGVEFFDVELTAEMQCDTILKGLKKFLPSGLSPVEVSILNGKVNSIQESIACSTYEVSLPNSNHEELSAAVDRFNDSKEMIVDITRGKRALKLNLVSYVVKLAVVRSCVIELALRSLRPGLKVAEFVQHGLKVTDENIMIMKTKVEWRS
ncbi:MAG: TIGR03936 family radical SAM-associated protein [Pseudomonadota bacterium]